MADQTGDANKLLEALTTSANRLHQLRTQVEQAEKEHASLLTKFLDAAQGNPAQLQFAVVQQGKTIAGGPLSKETIGIFRAIGGSASRIPPGEGAGCPDKAGCANVGQPGNTCFYICKTIQFAG
jgi:hypothetical protein